MANEYWVRLLVREIAEIAIFFYVGLVTHHYINWFIERIFLTGKPLVRRIIC
jgi:hypothetical protein